MRLLAITFLSFLSVVAHAQFIEREERDKHFPVPATWDRGTPHKVGLFTHMADLLPSCKIEKSNAPKSLPREPKDLLNIKYDAIFTYTLKEHLDKNYSMGFTFVRDGKIIDQHFQYGRRADDLFTSFSAGKSVISVLIGIALDEGLIKSLDDIASQYTDKIKNSSYSKIKIRSLLRMSSGIPYTEPDTARGDSTEFEKDLRNNSNSDIQATLNKWNRSSSNEGNNFNYASIETAVLAEVLRGATGKNICQYTKEKLWDPIGAEYDAYWETDSKGNVLGFSGFNATQTDYAKIGVMLANIGKINDKQVLSAEYIDQATNIDRQPPEFNFGKIEGGYGYQFWLRPKSGRYYMNGSHGQYVFVDRNSKSVMVIHTADNVRVNRLRTARTIRLFQSLINATNP